jgi:hypothetical protein
MKGVSIFFTIVLAFPILFYLLHILALYDSNGALKSFGVPESYVNDMAKPSIILLGVFLVALFISIFLTIKKSYTTNVIFLSAMISLYILMNIFHVPRLY